MLRILLKNSRARIYNTIFNEKIRTWLVIQDKMGILYVQNTLCKYEDGKKQQKRSLIEYVDFLKHDHFMLIFVSFYYNTLLLFILVAFGLQRKL